MFGRRGKRVSKLAVLAEAVHQLDSKVSEQSSAIAAIHQLPDVISTFSTQLETYQKSSQSAVREAVGKIELALDGVRQKLEANRVWEAVPPGSAFQDLPEAEIRDTIVWPISPPADLVLTVANPFFPDHSVTYLILPRRFATTVALPFAGRQITGLCIDWDLAPRGLEQAIQTLTQGHENEVWLSIYTPNPEKPDVTLFVETYAMATDVAPRDIPQGERKPTLLFDRQVRHRRRVGKLRLDSLDVKAAATTLPLNTSQGAPQA